MSQEQDERQALPDTPWLGRASSRNWAFTTLEDLSSVPQAVSWGAGPPASPTDWTFPSVDKN